MKKINLILNCVYIICAFIISSMAYGQENESHNHEIIDKNPIYLIKGNGFEKNDEGKNRIRFSKMIIDGDNLDEVSLNNSEFTVNKDGIYKINLSSNLTEEEIQNKLAHYSVNINGKEAFGSHYNFPTTGEYEFQIQLKKGDKISFNIYREQDYLEKTLATTLKVRFTDPELITFIENH